ncbi:MAG: hypothetical protein ABFD54_07205 [Armatimonadota bacterium]
MFCQSRENSLATVISTATGSSAAKMYPHQNGLLDPSLAGARYRIYEVSFCFGAVDEDIDVFKDFLSTVTFGFLPSNKACSDTSLCSITFQAPHLREWHFSGDRSARPTTASRLLVH